MSLKYLQASKDTESAKFLYCLIIKNMDMVKNLLIWYTKNLWKVKIVSKLRHKYQVLSINA